MGKRLEQKPTTLPSSENFVFVFAVRMPASRQIPANMRQNSAMTKIVLHATSSCSGQFYCP
jgi:hypothetical protein